MLAHWPRRILLVCAAIAIWVNSGFGLISAPSGWKWCSVSQNDWNPSFSARMPWRTWFTSTSCAATWTSASEPSFTATPSLVTTTGKLDAPLWKTPISNIHSPPLKAVVGISEQGAVQAGSCRRPGAVIER